MIGATNLGANSYKQERKEKEEMYAKNWLAHRSEMWGEPLDSRFMLMHFYNFNIIGNIDEQRQQLEEIRFYDGQ